MLKRPARIVIAAGLALIIFLIVGQAAASLYTEILWFRELGFSSVFWTRVWAQVMVRVVAGGLGAALILLNLWVVVRQLGPVQLRRRYGNLEIAEQVPRRYVHAGVLAAALLAGWWLSGIVLGGDATLSVLSWLKRGPWGVRDPLFDRDLGFFVFSLPLYSRLLDYLLLVVVWAILLAVIGYVLVGAVRLRDNRLEIDENPRLHFAALIAALVLVFAARYWIGRYGILLEGGGFSGGVGYTDVHARLPAQRVLAVLSLAAAVSLVYGAWRRIWWPPVVAVGLLLFASVALGFVYPTIIQKLRVEPNQLAREADYIRWNVEFTRRAYGLHGLDPTAYAPRGQRLDTWSEAAPALERLALWDAGPLQTGFDQRQAFTAYYHFPSVHFDRYGPPGAEEQVAIAVREFSEEGLQPDNRTWRTLHLNPRQVRGLGAVVTPASQKTILGDPVFWLRDIAPVVRDPAAPPGVDLAEPTVYFGESMEGYLVLGSTGDSASAQHERSAKPGIRLASFTRTLAFSWRFGDQNLLFAGELTDSSRIIFRRRVGERVDRIAPFLAWDRDVHPVLARGRIVWMIDGYTWSPTFPIARRRSVNGLGDVRYLRNTVKATVDAVTGAVAFYALTDDDPILESYRSAFPGLIRSLSDMPEELTAHLRYPVSYLELQADVLKDYHVERPEVFFGGENRWEVPDEQVRTGAGAAYRPVYVFAQLPGGTAPEFLLMVPFIARDRQNMTALLMVRNDFGRYGDMLLLEFPRDRQVTGPRQVQSLIEQDPDISAELSLLREKGSDLTYGQVRIVPLDSAVVYVQPIYLSAAGTPVPQLQLVVASDGSTVSMGATLPAALEGLYGDAEGPAEPTPRGIDPAIPGANWPREAVDLLDQAEQALRAGDWAGFGERWQELRALLTRISRERGPR